MRPTLQTFPILDQLEATKLARESLIWRGKQLEMYMDPAFLRGWTLTRRTPTQRLPCFLAQYGRAWYAVPEAQLRSFGLRDFGVFDPQLNATRLYSEKEIKTALLIPNSYILPILHPTSYLLHRTSTGRSRFASASPSSSGTTTTMAPPTSTPMECSTRWRRSQTLMGTP